MYVWYNLQTPPPAAIHFERVTIDILKHFKTSVKEEYVSSRHTTKYVL